MVPTKSYMIPPTITFTADDQPCSSPIPDLSRNVIENDLTGEVYVYTNVYYLHSCPTSPAKISNFRDPLHFSTAFLALKLVTLQMPTSQLLH